MTKENEIVLFENQKIKLEVNMKDETVWLNQSQMAELFCHLSHIALPFLLLQIIAGNF